MFYKIKLQDHIREYIDNYVLCGICTNPETFYIKLGNTIAKQCKSCGKTSKFKMNPKMGIVIEKLLLEKPELPTLLTPIAPLIPMQLIL